MTRRPLSLNRMGAACLVVAAFAAGPAAAQTPSSTWIANASGNWSDTGLPPGQSNWSPAGPPASATTTVLQFNASGTSGYTATNDIADPFSLKGLIFASTSTAPITLAGNVGGTGSGALGFSATTPFINQNNSGAAVINNSMTTNNAASGSDLNFGGYGTGTVTINGVISGVGGIQITNLGNATYVLANNNTFQGSGLTQPTGTYSPFGTLMVTATGTAATPGTPFGSSKLVLQTGTVAIAPATTSPASDVVVGLAATQSFAFFAGGTLVLDKGGNTSLTVTAQQAYVILTGNSSSSAVFAPASGIANLGLLNASGTPVGEAFTPTIVGNASPSGSTTAPVIVAVTPPANGMLPPTYIGQASKTDSTGDFLTYFATPTVVGTNTYLGLARFQGYTNYSASGGSFATDTTGTEVSNVTAPTTAGASASPVLQALRVTGTTLTIASGATVTVGGANWYSSLTRPNQAGVNLNNATIGGAGTLAFGPAEIDLYGGAGTSTIAAQITSSNNNSVGPSVVKYGPGNIVIANSNNVFDPAAEYTLYGGALVIPGPGGTNQSTVLGTGAHTFVMRGGAFGITGGDYAPAAGTFSFLMVQGSGGFFVDANSTLTLAQSGMLSSLGASTGTGPMYKTGAGTLALGFGYSLSGVTGVTVNQGRLLVNAALTGTVPTSTGGPVPYVANNSGTIGGTGSVTGPVIVNPGGTVSPGVDSTIGTLTTGGAVFQPGGRYTFKYNPATATPTAGTDNDLLASAAGTLDLSALSSTNRFLVNLLPAASATPPGGPVQYTAGTFGAIILPTGLTGPDVTSLFAFTGAFAGTPSAAANGGVLSFTFTPVPEPGLVLLACAGVAGAGTWWRRRRAV